MWVKLVVTTLFGTEWVLKEKCLTVKSGYWRALLVRLWGALQYEAGSSVAWNARFAGVPCFPHGMKSIFISGGASIGRNAVIFQQVTIGSNTLADSGRFGAPEIGDDCYIGAGAKLIGKIKVGNHVRIGANAVVYQDVPDHSVVLSGEQRIRQGDNNMDNRFYSFRGRWCYFDAGRWVPVSDAEVLSRLQRGPLPP